MAIKTCAIKIKNKRGYSRSFKIICDRSSVRLLESKEQRYMKAIKKKKKKKEEEEEEEEQSKREL